MRYYRMSTTVKHPAAIVDFDDPGGKVFEYFVSGVGDGRFLEHATPRAVAQSGYTRKNIRLTDYVDASIGAPIVSPRFVEAIGVTLADDVDVHACTVRVQDEDFPFHLLRIKREIPGLIDVSRSSFRTLTDGRKMLSKPVYAADLEAVFHLARDPAFPTRHVGSERLKALVEANKLRVEFMPV